MDLSVYLKVPLQLDKICRVCLSQKTKMSPLYDACLDELLNSLKSAQVHQDDGLPSLLCEQCVLQCSNAYNFKQLYEKSDRILREYIKPEFQVQLQDSVMQIHSKIEVDESCEVDQYAKMANVVIKDEIEPDLVSCTDSEQNKIEHNDDVTQELNFVKPEASFAAKPPKVQNNITLADSSNLSNHNDSHAVESEKKVSNPYLCSVCDVAFECVSNLTEHLKLHTSYNLFSCNYCNKPCFDARSLESHVRSHTIERPHECNICLVRFKTVCDLNRHAEVHTAKKPNLCSICGKVYVKAGSLKLHMKTHTGDKSFICQTCGDAFINRCQLTVHQRVHTGGNRYSCKTCEKCFPTSKLLIDHKMMTHRVMKPLVCNVCGKRFKNSFYFKEHMKTHTEDIIHVSKASFKTYAGAKHTKGQLEEII